ncbi:MAG: hypothetical protein N2257_03890 [Thermodesulfovibrionales bacterium]|nr:hypothetical protein [Thermodesulfovibrionales bacterium]
MRKRDRLKVLKLSPNILFFLILICAVHVITNRASSAELSRDQEQKIEKIALILSEELASRNIKGVTLKNFFDLRGRTGSFEKILSEKLRKALIKFSKRRFKVFTKDSEFIIKGTVIPYSEKNRFDLKIELIKIKTQSQDEEVLFTYTGIFKR